MDLPEPDRAGFVDLGRMRLRVWEWGEESDPAVLCLHGAHDHGRMWDGFAPRLAARGLRVVAPDLRGHGDSGRLSSGHTWAAMTLDLALLARRLGPPIGVVGHSFGGGQGLHLAGVWPELVSWMVNLEGLGPPNAAFEELGPAEGAAAGLAAADRVRTSPPRVFPSPEAMVERRQRSNPRLPPAWVEHLIRHGSRPTDGGFTWKTDPVFGVGLPSAFDLSLLQAEHAQVTCPMLVLTGAEHDTWSELTPPELAERLAALPSARHDVVAGAGHYVHIEQPDLVLAAVDAFLAEVHA